MKSNPGQIRVRSARPFAIRGWAISTVLFIVGLISGLDPHVHDTLFAVTGHFGFDPVKPSPRGYRLPSLGFRPS
jgi:hypothetical protein